MWPWTSCALLTCAALLPARVQVEVPDSLSRTSWTTEDGLPQNSVASICQDSDGYLWVGTFGGLARFDGRHFKVFDVSSRPDLPSNRFHQVVAGEPGTLFMRVQDFGVVRFANQEFELVRGSSAARLILSDRDGRIWVKLSEAIGYVDQDQIEIEREGLVLGLCAAREGGLWLSEPDGEVLRREDGADYPLPAGTDLEGLRLPTLFEDRAGHLWAGNKDAVWRASDSSNSRFELVPGVRGPVTDITQDALDQVWIGCAEGLYRWDPVRAEAEFVLAGSFGCLQLDKRGNLWTGSSRGTGLQCVRSSPLRDATHSLGLNSIDAWAVTQGRDGSILVVQERGFIEARGETRESREFHANSRCALLARDQALWVGQTNGLYKVVDETRTFYSSEDGLRGSVRALFESRAGELWVGTSLGLYRMEDGRFTAVHPERLEKLRCILEEPRSGALWVGTQHGLARLEGEALTWLDSTSGLSPGSVRTLHLDERGVLWAGTYGGGLSRIEGESIVRFTKEKGLADNFLACILEDDDGRLWINSNNGPFVVRRADLDSVAAGEMEKIACVTFTHGEGAREANGGNQPAGWRGPDGRMWFPSIEGVTVANPLELAPDEAPPEVRIESLVLTESRALEVRFAALGFSAPERVQIQHRLTGHDSAWVDDDGSGGASYSYLRPGDYVLALRARNGFGPWSPIVDWSFEVEPKFHETPAFIGLLVLLAGLVIFALAERRIRSSRAHNAELLQLVGQRERAERSLSRSQAELSRLSRELLTNQEAERRHLSRELHDDVTQRLAALAIRTELVEARMDSATREQVHERLRDIAEATQTLAGDVQQLSRRLHPVGLRTLGLPEAVRQECEAFTRRDGIEVELVEDIASDEVAEDVAVAAFRVLQESLHNIEKHARAESVQVVLTVEDEQLVVTIRDRGCGFDFDADAEGGLGLITMRERAASIGGELSISSHRNEGTTVRLTAPGSTHHRNRS